MRDTYVDNTPAPQLRATFEGAQRFGLSADEAWRAVDEALLEVGTEATISEYLDELTGGLARRIVSAERSRAGPALRPPGGQSCP